MYARLADVPQEALDVGPLNPTRVWRVDIAGAGGAKKLCVADVDALYARIRESTWPAYYEHWLTDRPMRYMVDIDMKHTGDDDDGPMYVETEVFPRMLDGIPGLRREELLVYTATRASKFSYHIHLPRHYVDDVAAAKRLTEALFADCEHVDKGIYGANRCMRLPHCVKDGMTTPLTLDLRLTGAEWLAVADDMLFKAALSSYFDLAACERIDVPEPPPPAAQHAQIVLPEAAPSETRARIIERVPQWQNVALKATGFWCDTTSTYCPILDGEHSSKGAAWALMYPDGHIRFGCEKADCKNAQARVELDAPPELTEAVVVEFMNSRLAMLHMDGDPRYVHWDTRREQPRYLTLNGARQVFANLYTFRNNKPIGYFTIWTKSAQRREYVDEVFDPRPTPPTVLNQWKPFPVEPIEDPDPDAFPLIREYLCRVFGHEDVRIMQTVMAIAGQMFCEPWRKLGRAVMLYGDPGTGKSTWFEILSRCIGAEKCYQVVNNSAITGNFNAWRKNKLLLFMDEAMYSGRRKDVGIIKAMITEPRFDLRQKYLPAVQYPCYARVLAASNNFDANYVDPGERRWFNIEVGTGLRCNHAFFAALWDELNDGGLEWLMGQCILAYKHCFDPHDLPRSKYAIESKLNNLSKIRSWWHEWLQRHYDPAPNGAIISPRELTLDDAYTDYCNWTDGDYGTLKSRNKFVRAWKKECLPEACEAERRTIDTQYGKRRAWIMQLVDLPRLMTHFAENVLYESVNDVFA